MKYRCVPGFGVREETEELFWQHTTAASLKEGAEAAFKHGDTVSAAGFES